jgi:hypothetical protein
MKKTVDRFGRSAYGVELPMRNVNSEGKFVIPAFPQEQDLAELIVFLVEGNPEIKMEVARNNGVLLRTLDSFATSCMAAGVSFEQCPIDTFGAWLMRGTAKGPDKLVSRRGADWTFKNRGSVGYKSISLHYFAATKRVAGEPLSPVEVGTPLPNDWRSNSTPDGKFSLPANPTPRDIAELLVFLVSRSPEIQAEAAASGEASVRLTKFVGRCFAAGVVFGKHTNESLFASLADAAAAFPDMLSLPPLKGGRLGYQRVTFNANVAALVAGGAPEPS